MKGSIRMHQFSIAVSAVLLCLAVAPSFADAGSSETSPSPPRRDVSGGISMQGAFSPQMAQPQALEMRAGEMAERAQFWQLDAIRDQLLAVTVVPEADILERNLEEKAKDPSVIGIGVEVMELNTVAATQASLVSFEAVDGGTLLGLRIHAPGAVGIRLGLLIEHVPSRVSIAFADEVGSEPIAPPVTGEEITGLIETNKAAGDLLDQGRTYWSPVLDGEEALILIHVPAGVDPGEVRFSIPQISHMFDDPFRSQSGGFPQSASMNQSAAYCNLDATCYPEWSDEGGAVAKMVYTEVGQSYLCTGTLLNDSDPSGFVPYFLTANHCISTQTASSTLETHWYWQSAACGSNIGDSRLTRLYGGAKLLYANAEMDASFLRLNQSPPGGTYFLGWSTDDPFRYDDVTGIHHPDGDRKKISFGEFDGFQDCGSTSGSSFECAPATSATGNYLDVVWYSGTTEGGSSGSALLNSSGQVIGTLRGGNHSCSNPSGSSAYGRFSVAYEDGLKDWLDEPPAVTYTVTPSAGAGGSVSPSTPQTVAAGETQSFTVNANSSYTRSNIVDGTCPKGGWSGNTWSTGAINASCTVSFIFVAKPTLYTVTPSAGAGGSVSPAAVQQVTAGMTKIFAVTPGSGYTYSSTVGGTCPKGGWSGNTWTTGGINANCTVSFSFTASQTSYTVTPSAGAGGSVSPATAQMVPAGATRSTTATANVGYTPSSKVGGTCPMGGWTGNTWTTGAINSNCTVSFSFHSVKRFNDVPPVYWAWPHIVGIAEAGITTGCGPSLYCPGSFVTRSEMAAFLLRGIHGGSYTPPAPTGTRFSDVAYIYWAAGWIEQLAAEGVTLGCGGGRYCPENNVTRAEVAVFLLRSKYGSSYNPPGATGTRFKDVPKSYWAASWIENLAAEGVTTGCGGGNYCPDNSVTRAEMAVFLTRTFNLPLPPRL